MFPSGHTEMVNGDVFNSDADSTSSVTRWRIELNSPVPKHIVATVQIQLKVSMVKQPGLSTKEHIFYSFEVQRGDIMHICGF